MRLSVPAIAHTARNRLRDSSAASSSVLLAASCDEPDCLLRGASLLTALCGGSRPFWLASVAIQALNRVRIAFCTAVLSRCSFCAGALLPHAS